MTAASTRGLELPMIKKETLRESVRDHLRDAIICRRFKPGERLVETRIAKDLGTSQGPVREAIKELELMGFIDTVPYYGSFVHKFSQAEIKDNYRLRSLLETFAVEEAIEHLDDAGMARIEAAFQALKDSYIGRDPRQNTERDVGFHHEIIRASCIPMLERAWKLLNMAQWTFLTTSSGRFPIDTFAQLHEDIFLSIRDRDRARACALLKEHYDRAAEIAVGWLDES